MPATLAQSAIADAYAEALADFSAGRDDIVTTYVHADGSRTFIVSDPMPGDTESPREYAGNVATLINENSRTIDVDTDTAGLADARNRWRWPGHPDDAGMVSRYVAMFRPDIAVYVDHWQAGDSYGWGYVTREALSEAGYSQDNPGPLSGTLRMRARTLFDAEVKVYGQWAEGEVYGAVHVTAGEPVVSVDFTGSELVSVELEEESVWGFLGYDDTRDIAAQFTDSEIVGEE